MTVHGIGFIPAAPLMIPDLVGDAVERDAELRTTVQSVVRDLLTIQSDTGSRVLVVGVAATSGEVGGTWDFRGLGVPRRGETAVAGTPLPTSLGVGAWFLDEVAPDAARDYLGIALQEPPEECVALGGDVEGDRVILAVGDGSACHGDKAPGREDARADDIDGVIATAIASGDPSGLLTLEPQLCADLLVEGRAPWQVAAAAAVGQAWRGDLRLDVHPYGVGYLAGLWSPVSRG